jgi:hypothetical protein
MCTHHDDTGNKVARNVLELSNIGRTHPADITVH